MLLVPHALGAGAAASESPLEGWGHGGLLVCSDGAKGAVGGRGRSRPSTVASHKLGSNRDRYGSKVRPDVIMSGPWGYVGALLLKTERKGPALAGRQWGDAVTRSRLNETARPREGVLTSMLGQCLVDALSTLDSRGLAKSRIAYEVGEDGCEPPVARALPAVSVMMAGTAAMATLTTRRRAATSEDLREADCLAASPWCCFVSFAIDPIPTAQVNHPLSPLAVLCACLVCESPGMSEARSVFLPGLAGQPASTPVGGSRGTSSPIRQKVHHGTGHVKRSTHLHAHF